MKNIIMLIILFAGSIFIVARGIYHLINPSKAFRNGLENTLKGLIFIRVYAILSILLGLYLMYKGYDYVSYM